MRLTDLFTRRPRPISSAELFRRFLIARGLSADDGAPRPLFDAFIDFHQTQRFAGLAEPPDGDMLLFQYGCYDWGEGERFELDITRQFAERRSHDLSQLHLTFLAPPDASLRALGAGEVWSCDCADLAAFRAKVQASDATAALQARPQVDRELAWWWV